MTYNILAGGKEGMPAIIQTIKQEAPDYLTINEANTFVQNNNELLNLVSKEADLPYSHLALSGQQDFHVAAYSRYPFKKLEEIKPLTRAAILTVIDTEYGELSIIGAHLSPFTEDSRLREIQRIMDAQKPYIRRVLMGDLNSLSRDNYNPKIIESFDEVQKRKFTRKGRLSFDVTDKILSEGYFDVALEQHQNNFTTMPTHIDEQGTHQEASLEPNLRLDYVFVSRPLLEHVTSYQVVRNEITNYASDHYPVAVIFDNIKV